MESIERQFARLTRLVMDGIATDSDRTELSRISTEHPELVTTVLDELTIDTFLKWQSGRIVEELPLMEVGVTIGQIPSDLNRNRYAIPPWIGMIAATVLIAVGLLVWMSSTTEFVDPVIADVVDQDGFTWTDASTALAADGTIRRGRLSTSGGVYTLQFRDGPTVRVVGKSSLDIKSKMLVQLDYGQATAKVPEGSSGFTIKSAMLEVVDLGTQFGISAENGRTDVVVFEGKVDVKLNTGKSDLPKRLIQGEAIEVDDKGELDRLVDIRCDVDGEWWSGDQPNANRNVIARVTDNVGGSEELYVCYQTTYHGLRDDVLAYSDNPNHQWNGLTSDGLPEFLRGADYIKTFNHYRYIRYFKMTIEFSKPANLYVFADNRIPPPPWLVDEFEDTGVDIGLDEGPWLDVIPEEYRKLDVNTTAVGAGKSIDNVFSVWRRRCADGAPITLGSAGEWGGEGGQGRAMYGIAATPLEDVNESDKTIDLPNDK